MDEVNSLHYDETPKAKFIRYIIWGSVAIFIITVTLIALVEGFKSGGQEGHAFLGIACFVFTFLTFVLQYKIVMGQLPDAARIPVYLQLACCVFFGISILMTLYSKWYPVELDCYYNSPGTFARQTGSPSCWKPPSCFQQTNYCLMYTTTENTGDHCVSNKRTENKTTGVVTYNCEYIIPAPTTTKTPSTPPASNSIDTFEAFESAKQLDNKQQNLVLDYVYSIDK